MLPSREPFQFQLQFADYAIIGVVLLLLVGLGVVCQRLVANPRDFFVGGGRMSWWLAGMSVFMGGFSAWTFTGAAGLAYTNGTLAILYFCLGNGLGFFFSAAFIAHRVRQTRKVTTMEIMRDRYGRVTEQIVVALQLLSVLPMGAVWLTGLALFFSVGFAVPMAPCIIVAGTIIIIYSTLGGSWAVATSDFVHGILLLCIIVLIAGLSVALIGGAGELVEKVPSQVLRGFDGERTIWWLLAGASMSFMTFSSFAPAARFLAVPDGRSARKVALLAGVLFVFGPVLWFTPPIVASYFYPDLASSLPQLNHPHEGAYVIMGLSVLPAGLAGLLLVCIFGATLTTLDSAVNQSAGFLTLNVYRTWIHEKASDRELVLVARVFSVLFGTAVMSMALWLASSEEHSLLDLNLNLQSIVAIPILVPFFLLWFMRRAPWWAALASIGLGIAASSALNKNVYWPELAFHVEPFLVRLFGGGEWTAGTPFPFAVRVFGTMSVSVAVFVGTRAFWGCGADSARQAVVAFYDTMDRPVESAGGLSDREDPRQFAISGGALVIVGLALTILGVAGLVQGHATAKTVWFGVGLQCIGGALILYSRGVRWAKVAPAAPPPTAEGLDEPAAVPPPAGPTRR